MLKNIVLALTLAAAAGAAGVAQAQPAKGSSAFGAQDFVEIQQLYARYNEAIDSGNAEAWVATFTPDGVFNTFNGREGLMTFAEQYKGKMNGTRNRHWNTNLIITPTAEGASGSVYLMLVDVSAKPPVIASTLKYDDLLVKTAQGWRFKKRATRADTAPPAKPLQ
jgi:hypothetical protein